LSSLATISLQQRIYEFCYQLGMPLKFCNRRRIQIGPKSFRSVTKMRLYAKGSLSNSYRLQARAVLPSLRGVRA